MKSRIKQLKVKVKSLAAEARIIRREENRAASPQLKLELKEHRRGSVRNTTRQALLAYGFLRGRPYCMMEAKAAFAPDWADLKAQVQRFGVCLADDEARADFVARRDKQEADLAAWVSDAQRLLRL